MISGAKIPKFTQHSQNKKLRKNNGRCEAENFVFAQGKIAFSRKNCFLVFFLICEGLIGDLQMRKFQAVKQKEINTIPELITVFRESYAWRRTMDAFYREEIFIEYIPDHKTNIKLARVDPKSLPCNLTDCYNWTAKIDDRSRRGFIGRDGQTLTCLRLRACVLPGRDEIDWVYPKVTWHSKRAAPLPILATRAAEAAAGIAPAEVDPEIDDEMDAEQKENVARLSYIPYNVFAHNGWKVSWRKDCPEQRPVESFYPRLDKKFAALGQLMPADVGGCRHDSAAKKFSAARMIADKNNERQAHVRLREKTNVLVNQQALALGCQPSPRQQALMNSASASSGAIEN